jgi:hypothetical protein
MKFLSLESDIEVGVSKGVKKSDFFLKNALFERFLRHLPFFSNRLPEKKYRSLEKCRAGEERFIKSLSRFS